MGGSCSGASSSSKLTAQPGDLAVLGGLVLLNWEGRPQQSTKAQPGSAALWEGTLWTASL